MIRTGMLLAVIGLLLTPVAWAADDDYDVRVYVERRPGYQADTYTEPQPQYPADRYVEPEPQYQSDRYGEYDTTYRYRIQDQDFDRWYSNDVGYWRQYGLSRGYGELKDFDLHHDDGKLEGEIEYERGTLEFDDGKIKFDED